MKRVELNILEHLEIVILNEIIDINILWIIYLKRSCKSVLGTFIDNLIIQYSFEVQNT